MTKPIHKLLVATVKRNQRFQGSASSANQNALQDEVIRDFLSLQQQWNTGLVPLISLLPDGTQEVGLNAFTAGLDGRTMFVKANATLATAADGFYNTTKERPNTVFEQFEGIYSSISTQVEALSNRIDEVETSTTTVEGGDVSSSSSSSTDNTLVRMDGTTGKIIQNSNAVLSDGGALTLLSTLVATNGTFSSAVTGASISTAGALSGGTLSVSGAATITGTLASGILSVNSGAVDTTAIATFANSGGNFQFFRTDATPAGSVTGSKGDLAFDTTGGVLYLKTTDGGTSGWVALATGGGLSEASANALYLRLDGANDPVTGAVQFDALTTLRAGLVISPTLSALPDATKPLYIHENVAASRGLRIQNSTVTTDLSSTTTGGLLTTSSAHPLMLGVDGTTRLTLATDGTSSMPGVLTTGGLTVEPALGSIMANIKAITEGADELSQFYAYNSGSGAVTTLTAYGSAIGSTIFGNSNNDSVLLWVDGCANFNIGSQTAIPITIGTNNVSRIHIPGDGTKIIVANPIEAAGVIHSTTGGIRFPDNTTQTTAAAGGDVVGPASSVDSNIAIFDGTTGKLLKNAPNLNVSASGQISYSRNTNTDDIFIFSTNTSASTLAKATAIKAFNNAGHNVAFGLNGGGYTGVGGANLAFVTASDALKLNASTTLYLSSGGTSRVSVSTTDITSTLPVTAAGIIWSTSGGIKFPDNTVQTTAAIYPVLYAYKTADTSRASTNTQTVDNHLALTLAANSVYHIEAHIYIVAGAGGAKWDLYSVNVSAGINYSHYSDGNTVHNFYPNTPGASQSAAESYTGVIDAMWETDGTGGIVGIWWSQNAVDVANTTLKKYSYIKATKVA